MADLAEQQTLFAKLQTWLVGIGTFVLVITLYLTRESVKAAIKAAGAANKSVKVTSDTARKQLRAYVSTTKADLLDPKLGEPTRARLGFRNTGQTPAYNVSCKFQMGFRHTPLTEPLVLS